MYTSVTEHLARYFDAVDRADIDEVMRILDGTTLVAGAVETADTAAIRGVYESRRAEPRPDGSRMVKHHLGQVIVDSGDESGGVVASAYYMRLEPRESGGSVESGPVIAVSGRLRQTLTRDGEVWNVHRHEIIADL